jgi:hypothetical protein
MADACSMAARYRSRLVPARLVSLIVASHVLPFVRLPRSNR